MSDTLAESIDSVFSVLPLDQANEASRDLLVRYLAGAGASTLTWVDFDRSGGFVRAGLTYTADLSTCFIAQDAANPDVNALIDGIGTGPVQAGRICHAEGSDRFLWYLPYRKNPAERSSRIYYKGLAISAALFDEVIDMFNPAGGITPAEKRMLFQLVVGATPRAAAEADSVSFETKRAQIKSLCSKLDCRSQTALVRLTLGQLVHLVHVGDGDIGKAQTIEAFTQLHLPSNIRLIIHPLDDGRYMRTFECGPVNGRPVLHIHGMLFPLLITNGAAICERLGIRLITPVREGYLDDQPGSALFEQMDPLRNNNDLARYIDQRFGRPLPVIGHSIGSIWALQFARQHPHHVASLTLLSPNFSGDRHGTRNFQPLIAGLKGLVERPGMFRYLAWQFRKYYADEKTVRRVLRKLFGPGNCDLAVLDGEIGACAVYGWFVDSYRSSVVGIAEDMALGIRGAHNELASARIPVRVVFGPDDMMSGFAHGESDSSQWPGITTVSLPAGGHLVAASHPEAVWSAITAGLPAESSVRQVD